MTPPVPALYEGMVVHARFRPVQHKLAYRVFSLLLDCGALPSAQTRLFSVNRPNLLSFYERDHGDGGPLLPYLKRLAAEAGVADRVARFFVLAYPRVLGFAFNPLTVYYGLDGAGRIALMVYEVHNTFRERLTYVIAEPATPELGAGRDEPAPPDIAQSCAKALHVSPFNRVEGRYHFRVSQPGEALRVGVRLDVDDRPVMSASFAGRAAPLTDRAFAAALLRTGWMTVKVVVGIYWEALRLRLKGLRLQRKPAPPAEAYRIEGAQDGPAGADPSGGPLAQPLPGRREAASETEKEPIG